MGMQQFDYSGKRVLVLGGATGMGAAAAKLAAGLGGEVTALDVAAIGYPTAQSLHIDLRDQASVDATLSQLDGRFDVFFSCAGVADGTPGLMAVNFISQRHCIEQLLAKGLLGPGAAIVMIASVAGLPWLRKLGLVMEFLQAADWSDALAWIDAHPGTDNYMFSKQAMCGYVAQQAFALLKQGVRINSVMPGPTDTPLARANADIWLAFGKDYREAAGQAPLSVEQVAGPMAFLGSDAASGVTGANLVVDQGYMGAGVTDAFDAPLIKAMLDLS